MKHQLEMKDNDVAVIPGLKGREPKEIKLTTLASIIQARMEEIIEHVYFEIKSSGFEKKLIGGIVITGGGSQMKHITQLFQYVTGMDCRIGYPNEHVSKSPNKELFLPMFSTGIGLVMKGFEGHSTHVSDAKPVEKDVKPLETPVEQPIVKQEKRGMTNFLNAVRDWFDTEEE